MIILTDKHVLLIQKNPQCMIIHVLKFQAKTGKEKTVHKIIRKSLHLLRKQEHKGMSYYSFRDTNDPRKFIHINTFESAEAEQRYGNSSELKNYFNRLNTVVEGCIDYHVVESFEFYQGRG